MEKGIISQAGWWLVGLVCGLGGFLWWVEIAHPAIWTVSGGLGLVGRLLGILGFGLFAVAFVLNTRWGWVENLFGGLNKVYIAHHIVGGLSFIFLLLHPVLLGVGLWQIDPGLAAQLVVPGASWPVSFGIFALLTMQLVLIVTFFGHWAYQKWKALHQWMGLAFGFGIVHAVWQTLDSGLSGVLIYLISLSVVAAIAFSYRTLLGHYLVPKLTYRVARVEKITHNVLEIEFAPKDAAWSYLPGQFVFVSFRDRKIGHEYHPFSITSTGKNITVGVKVAGDFTKKLYDKLQSGGEVYLERPYGRFSISRLDEAEKVWIAGGIGITPFVSMAKALPGDGARVNLWYSMRDKADAAFVDDLSKISKSNRRFLMKTRVSDKDGKLTGSEILAVVEKPIMTEFFICGPTRMMADISRALRLAGVPKKLIHTEVFELTS